jgi:uncharacterized protein YfbU (UPF0304 family)
MATLTVRISDETRDGLQKKADKERKTLSDFVRERLDDAVFDYREEQGDPDSGPQSMTRNERHMFSLLHRILGRVLPEDANDIDGDTEYQLERAEVLEQGFSKEYWMEFAGLRPELSARQCEFVMDVLDMFRMALYSINKLHETGTDVSEDLQRSLSFSGFDHNDTQEGQLSDYVAFLVKSDKWSEQKDFVLGPERGNSHMQMSAVYSRMLTAYREVKQARPKGASRSSYFLTDAELREVAAARIHPTNR